MPVYATTTTKGDRRYKAVYRRPDNTQTSKTFKGKRDADLWEASQTADKSRGDWISPTEAKMTIEKLGEIWLSSKRTLKPASYKPLEVAWERHVKPRWGSKRLKDIQHWIFSLG